MNNIKFILMKIGIVILLIVALFYISFLTIVPKILSSHKFLDFIDEFIAEKTGIVITSDNLNVKTSPFLLFTVSAENFILNSYDKELLKVKNASITYDLKQLKAKNAEVEYIYLNQQNFNNVVKVNNSKKASKLKLNKIPKLHVKKAEIWALKGKNDNIFINVENLTMQHSIIGKTTCTFEAEIFSDLLKNSIQIGRNGFVYIEHNKLFAQDLEVLIGVAVLNINGKLIDKNKKSDFTIYGDNIPISDIAASLLYFQKLKDKSKKFMENFYDYNGKLNVELKVNEKGIWGECKAKNLTGKTKLFNVPILFPEVLFKFKEKEFSGGAYGILGEEKVYADFDVTNLGTIQQEAKGSVHSRLTKKSVDRYVPNAKLVGKADASVNWHIKNKKINVYYDLYIPQNSDIYYMDAYLGLIDKNRNMHVETYKNDDKLRITNYEYSMEEEGKKTKIILGDGLFTKRNDNFQPDYITCRTENDAPVSVAASFYKYLEGGVFSGNLKYNFIKNKITGNFNIKNSVYKDYKINEAKVTATIDEVKIETDGTYKKSPFNAKITGLNDFNNKIQIYNLYLFLDEYVVIRGKKPKKPIQADENKIKTQLNNFDIDLYTIKLNKIFYKKAVITNILVTGSIKNNIFKFKVPHVNFANGILLADGLYDFNKRNSNIVIQAQNLNANIIADTIFNLPNQVEGTANGTITASTKNGIHDRKSHIEFQIKEGYLPKLGSTEFMIKQAKLRKKPFKLEDVVKNIDIKNMKALASNINGSFDYSKGKITNSHITSSQKYLSLLILGDYDTEKQIADLKLFGKYNNKEISKIKIFFVPLSIVIKVLFRPEKTIDKYENILKEVPPVNIQKETDESAFRVKIQGDINKNRTNIEMKSII